MSFPGLSQDNLYSRVLRLEEVSEATEPPPEDTRRALLEKVRIEKTGRNQKAVALLSRELGILNFKKFIHYDTALFYLMEALKIEDTLDLKQEMIVTYVALAKVFEEVDELHKSSELLEQALSYAEYLNQPELSIYLMNRLGRLYAARVDSSLSYSNFSRVMEQLRFTEGTKAESDALFNMAGYLTGKGHYREALDFHRKALGMRRKLQDSQSEAASLHEIGELYQKMKNPARALANHVVALEIRQKLSDLKGLAESYNSIGIHYYENNNTERAILNLELGLENARKTNWASEMHRSFEALSLCHEQSGNFQQAFLYQKNENFIQALLLAEKEKGQLIAEQNKYLLNKQKIQIENLKLIEKQKETELTAQREKEKFLYTAIASAVIIILLSLYFLMLNRRANKKLEAANAKVSQQNTELQSLNATKDKFFSIISHDLKGPLNSFTAFSGMLINYTDSLTPEEIKELAREIDKNLKNVLALLENLLEWSRSQTGNIPFRPERFDINAVMEQNRDLLNTQAANKKIKLVYEPVPGTVINADKNSITTVVRNLVSNAIKFTPEGGTITLGLKEHQQKLWVSVADTGVGMERAVIDKLFRIDTKYSTQGTANEKGTGLGLILCKEFVEKNGGTIGVKSEPGKGSVFYFTLPLDKTQVVQESQAFQATSV